MTRKTRCNQCERRVDVAQILTGLRYGGGNWRRAGRNYKSAICVECATELVATQTQGHYLNACWDVAYLQRQLESRKK